MGRPRIDFDEHDRKQIIAMAAAQLTDDEIAVIIGKSSEKTLQTRCRKELNLGRKQGRAKLKQVSFRMATRGDCPTMTIWMTKVLLGWREHDSSIPGEKPERPLYIELAPGQKPPADE